ncbi:class I SAM-dependent methyltransferase [Aspergillus lucknowensis]|uniref:S-adenosyl-L-methionine-dependent methyltransferase n=1 Tax=Aspergillus lucknowensis TaxID=176173 RepID=A0ABR4LG30_9EURO
MTETASVAKWYNENAALEHDRLIACRLEFSISWRIITQYLDGNKPLEILDLGGGTGRYATKLAKLGHSVTLVDISEAELDIARSIAKEESISLTDIIQADARDIRSNPVIFQEQKYDLILCQGPFYHLLEESERLDVLSACAAAVKPGGFILAAFVLRYAHLRDIAQRDPARLAREYDSFYAGYLAEGKYTRNTLSYSYHTHPSEVNAFFAKVPELQLERQVACEGFLGGGLSSKLGDLPGDAYENSCETENPKPQCSR